MGLHELDLFATNSKHKEEVPKEKKAVLQYMQPGSNWSKTITAKTGRTDCCIQDHTCDLCKIMKEEADHIWYCPALRAKAKEMGPVIASIDPDVFPPALRKGVAPAMHANPKGTFWGGGIMTDATEDQRKLLGITPDLHISSEVAPFIAVLQAEGEWGSKHNGQGSDGAPH